MIDWEEVFVGIFSSVAWISIVIGFVKLIKWAWGS